MRKPHMTLVALLGLVATFPAFARAADAPPQGTSLRVGQSFSQARANLVRQGWKPVRNGTQRQGRTRDPQSRQIARSFPEVDSCSLGQVFCILYYKKAGTCLRVDTVGEEAEDMKVTRWVQECAGAQPDNVKE